MADELDESPAPPDPRRVARRAMVLAAVVCRANSDHDPSNPDAIDLWERLKTWIDRLGLETEMEPWEQAMLYAPLGTREPKQRIRATWEVEGLGILAWALQLLPLPKLGEKVNGYEVTDSLLFLSDEALEILDSPTLRPPEELDACRELMYATHCRLREYQRTREAKSIAHWIEPQWLRVLGVESPLGPQEDLRIGEVEISQVSDETVQQCEWAVSQRHRAIVWLVGAEGPVYSQVPADTQDMVGIVIYSIEHEPAPRGG